MKSIPFLLAFIFWQQLCVANESASFEQNCLSFDPQDASESVSVAVQEYVAAGTNLTLNINDPSCSINGQKSWVKVEANLCRIVLHVSTSNASNLTMEAWFPENWAGRVLAVGNGGIDGCIYTDNVAYGATNGFATVGTNNGHWGVGGQPFLNNPDNIVDFNYRALHTGISELKTLATIFYDSSYNKSYLLGCSTGGRQGLGAADRFPEDFDGIIAGAPAAYFNNLYAWRASFYPITGKNTSEDFVTSSQWAAIHQEVLKQCDMIDGVGDGISEDPGLCKFRPEAMLCEKANDTCLSPAQVEIVNRIFSPLYGAEGKLLYPAMNPGSELAARTGLYSGLPYQMSQDWYRYVLLNDSTWDQLTFNATYATLSDQNNPTGIRTWPSNLAPFAQRGGKLLTFHGQQDQQISSFQSPRLYDHLARGMTAPQGNLDDFYRFFQISGMGHCFTGPGAWAFGQWGGASSTRITFDAEVNLLAALVGWVEKGVAPETIMGTRFVDDDPSKGIAFQRRHCRYPQKNKYTGGDPSNPSSWECKSTE